MKTQLSKEIEVLNKFMRLLDTNPDKAYYGYLHVQKANEELAIDSLLISDDLFRSSDVITRKKYVSLVESVREKGGTVYVFSTMHVSGQVCHHLPVIVLVSSLIHDTHILHTMIIDSNCSRYQESLQY